MIQLLEECFSKGLIERFPQGPSLVEESLKKARELLDEAERNLGVGSFNSVVLLSYSSAFLALRALMFRDGYREKSHGCLSEYIRSKHREIPEHLIDQFDHFRHARHGTPYDVGYFTTEEDCREALEFAKEVVDLVEEVVQ